MYFSHVLFSHVFAAECWEVQAFLPPWFLLLNQAVIETFCHELWNQTLFQTLFPAVRLQT